MKLVNPHFGGATLPLWLSVEDAAAQFAMSKASVYNLLNAGRINGRKFGRRTMIETASFHAYMQTLPKFEKARL